MKRRNQMLEVAVAALIEAGQFDLAAWTAQQLPAGKQRKALREIARAL